MRMRHFTLALLFVFCADAADARSTSLDVWTDRELIPHITETITSHPRFKGETLMFVVLANNEPAPVSNTLALDLRDRVLESAIDTPHVRIAWQQRPHASKGCREDRVDYLIGLELARELSGQYAVTLRALDVAEQNWVGGFGKSWRGRLNARELSLWRATAADPAFLGTRDVPYAANQVDLIAQHLSHQLACDIHGSFKDDFVVALDAGDADTEPLGSAVTLAARNLDQQNALALTSEPDSANAEMHGKAHSISGTLHQYWLSITPTSKAADLDSLSRSVYVNLPVATRPDEQMAFDAPSPQPEILAERLPARVHGVEMPGNDSRHLLQPLGVYRDGNCRDQRNCSVLQARAANDVIMFTLVNTEGRGLKRLGDDACRARSAARVVSAGHSALFPVPGHAGPTRAGAASQRWLITPPNTTYYAIAIDNARDARRVAAIIDELPAECAGSYAAGLTGLDLERWLERLSHLMLALGRHAQWRALEVKPVY